MSLRSEPAAMGHAPSLREAQPESLGAWSAPREASPDSRVQVTYRKRRAVDADNASGASGTATGLKAPRVFVVRAADASNPPDAASPVPEPLPSPPMSGGLGEPPAALPRRRRRRGDPSRAPGEVTRIVFAATPPVADAVAAAEPAAPGPSSSASPSGWPFEAGSSGYATLTTALDEVRATLAQARRARGFRIL